MQKKRRKQENKDEGKNWDSEWTHFLRFYFFYFERERAGGGVEEEGERQADSTLSAEPNAGLSLTGLKIIIWAKIKNQMLNQLNLLGAPEQTTFDYFLWFLYQQNIWYFSFLFSLFFKGGQLVEVQRIC